MIYLVNQDRKDWSSAILFSLFFSKASFISGVSLSYGTSVARRWIFATGKEKLKSNRDVKIEVKSFELEGSAETSCGFDFNEAFK